MSWFQIVTPPVPPVVLAHRGDAVNAPENTMAAFRAAIAAGARAIETDVQLSGDGVLFLLHDDDTARTTDSSRRGLTPGTLADTLTYADLAAFDAGGWFAPAFSGESIPRLRDLGDLLSEALAAGRPVGLDLEIKTPLSHSAAEVVGAVAREFARPVWEDLLAAGEIVITSFDPEVIAASLDLGSVPIGLLTAATPGPDAMADLGAEGLTSLVTSQEDVSAEAVAAAHAAGLAVGVYTANAPDWERVIAAGVDAICTDDPGGLTAYLAR